ncbi:MAG: hypothetical protein IKH04_10360, partial [Kiritimatiellae bacterium]|nr:hypothetical protein [Kiritimatiellia bacterium]
MNSVSFVAKSNWQLALAIGNILTLTTFSNLAFLPRFARIEGANAKGRIMIEKAATDIYTFENLRKNQYTYVDKTAILKELADDTRGRQFFI